MALEAAGRVRNINLIEVLKEEAEASGVVFEEPADLVDRGEAAIRAFFKQLSLGLPSKDSTPHFLPPAGDSFRTWFPGFGLSRTASSSPRRRVLCFPNAGSAEDMYTSEGTGARRAASPLLVSPSPGPSSAVYMLQKGNGAREGPSKRLHPPQEWCRANDAECLAVQLPGRNLRRSEPPFSSCQQAAEALFPVVASSLATTPYLIVAHSVGCWVAYEFLVLARSKGLRMPEKAFLSAMAAPRIATAEQPWRQQHQLTESEFKEECRAWDVNEVVFSAAMWSAFEPLMRADFTLFDQYRFQHTGEESFSFPITGFWGTQDRRITESMVKGWRDFTNGQFATYKIEGHHLWPLQPASKKAWLQLIVDEIPQV